MRAMAAMVATANTSPPRIPLGYQLRLGTQGQPFDEMVAPSGGLREHWHDISAFFERLGPAEIGRRWNQARKILHDNGVAYNVQNQGLLRTWELNPVPLRLAGDDWQFLAKAVRQRARLLNAILEDVYGPQKLLADKLIPPSLIYGHSAYLRPCHGIPVPRNSRLAIYAVDLARSPDGNWWVISDRTQSPSGMGYTLENRLVLSRVFPEIFREARIARLGGFFTAFGESLAALSPRPGTEPTVVLLTPGPLNETYFEQAYLARHLGCPLVQGQDLTVREGRVFIKTLEGLRQVDVIIRRVDEDFCDPLELRDDSLLGVPGLLSAVRAGTVALANALGSGVVQSTAIHAFLPSLSRAVLDEDLLMPSVATWWCGETHARSYTLNNLHGLLLKDAFEYNGTRPSPSLSRPKLREAILARPQYFAAQENVLLSQCPDFVEGRLESRSVLLRVFAVRQGDDYVVLPGGMTRVAAEESSFNILLQQSGGSKDTWVDIEEEPTATSTPVLPSELRRSHLELTSRVADNLFWLGRYAERADFTARIVRCTLENFAEESGWVEQIDVMPMLRTLEHFDQFVSPPPKKESLDHALARQMADPDKGGTLASLLRSLQGLAAAVRDQISNDTWRILNVLGESGGEADLSSNETALGLNKVILALSAFQGLLGENMPHGHAWRFLDLGRRLERGIYLSRLVRETLTDREETPIGRHELLLETLDALVTYRQKHTTLRAAAVLDLVLCDESNPRSLASQFAVGMDHLRKLPREADGHFKLPEERRLLAVLSELRLLDPSESSEENRDALLDTLERAEKALTDCSELVTLRFFTHLRTSSVGRDTARTELPASL
jgi:uncharacterized circularly permuted ATP-grasp superfamily protein/uncharacterized alpha-E superfamily protein